MQVRKYQLTIFRTEPNVSDNKIILDIRDRELLGVWDI